MKALILNSGIGSRMGVLTSEHPKCMTVSSTLNLPEKDFKAVTQKGKNKNEECINHTPHFQHYKKLFQQIKFLQ